MLKKYIDEGGEYIDEISDGIVAYSRLVMDEFDIKAVASACALITPMLLQYKL